MKEHKMVLDRGIFDDKAAGAKNSICKFSNCQKSDGYDRYFYDDKREGFYE